MRKFNNLYYTFAVISILFFSSCKKVVKNTIEELGSESVEKISKEVSEEFAEETAEKIFKNEAEDLANKSLWSISKKELLSLKIDDIFDMIKDKNINIDDALSKVSSSFKTKIGKALQKDHKFYSSFISDASAIDNFKVFAKESPTALDNIDLFRYFVLSKYSAKRNLSSDIMQDILLKDDMGIVKMFNKSGNLIGELKDGILHIKTPIEIGDDIFSSNLLKDKLFIPNTTYKLQGKNGLSYLISIDDIGRISKIKSKNINADELASNVVSANGHLDLGSDWLAKKNKIKQSSKGNDIDAEVLFTYANDNTQTPSFIKTDIQVKQKSIVKESFENVGDLSRKVFSSADNESLLKKYQHLLSDTKRMKLLDEMGVDQELTKMMHSNPDNIKRWLNTRNPVDKSKLARTANGAFLPNAKIYAGNVYYFNPHLNSALMARLKKNGGVIKLKNLGTLTYDDLIKLDKLYPDGVPFTKEGYIDLTAVAVKDKLGKPIKIDIGKLSGSSQKDISKAETAYQKLGYKWEPGFTWHHIENSNSLLRVPTVIHQLIDHAGGMSTHNKSKIIKEAIKTAA